MERAPAQERARDNKLKKKEINKMTQETITPEIRLTKAAVEAVRERIREANMDDAYFYLGVKGGACAGYSYHMDITNELPSFGDVMYHFDGIKVVVNSKSLPFLKGSVLDFKSTLMGSRFWFNNPNATKSCGCNLSFDVT